MGKTPVLDRVLRRAHSQLKGEIDAVIDFIRECQKPFPKDLGEHSKYIDDRLPGGQYHTKAQTEAYDKLLVLGGEDYALHAMAYHEKISLELIRGINMLVGKQGD